jgi:GT2 family glycosyltransferase
MDDVGPASTDAEAAPIRIQETKGVRVSLAAGERLHRRAAELVSREFERQPGVEMLYADVVEGGRVTPKPAWDDVLARHYDMAGAPVFFRASLAPSAEQSLREGLRTGKTRAGRIALPLSARPTAPAALPPVKTPLRDTWPSVSVVIPTKLRIDLLKHCLDGLARSTDYPNLEVVIVDNGSEHPELAQVLADASRVLKLGVVEDRGDFNFSRLANGGVRASTGEIVLLLNDDVQPLEVGWLHRMVASAMEPDVGVVGCRLLYPDGTIQHAGVAMGLAGPAGHLWKGLTREEAASNPYVVYPSQRLAVTGACLATRREVFDCIGGLDEEAFPVAFNDIDFCLRLRSIGLRTVYRGDSVLIHHESQSRGADDIDLARRKRLAAETAAFLTRWRSVTEDDPFASPAFDPTSETGALHPAVRTRASDWI